MVDDADEKQQSLVRKKRVLECEPFGPMKNGYKIRAHSKSESTGAIITKFLNFQTANLTKIENYNLSEEKRNENLEVEKSLSNGSTNTT